MYPKHLMSETYWVFYGGMYNSYDEFIQEVIDYNKDLGKQWTPQETVLGCQNVTIQYSYWNNEEDNIEEKDFDLTADRSSGFTAGEILYKIHNQVVDKLENEDFHFFEGLTLWKRKEDKEAEAPLYYINQEALKLYG
jgi:hypothetical protein